MSQEKFNTAWDVILAIARQAQFVEVDDIHYLLDTVSAAHSVLPIIDPTAYRNGAHNLDDQRDIANGFLAFRQAIEKVATRAKETKK